jgi:hypothetical protein
MLIYTAVSSVVLSELLPAVLPVFSELLLWPLLHLMPELVLAENLGRLDLEVLVELVAMPR